MPKYLTGKINGIKNLSSTTRHFSVEVEDTDVVDFKAGQFVTMELPIHEKRLKRMRSYSIANAPSSSNILEFCIVQLEGGAATTYLFEEAGIGAALKFKYPAGVFTLPKEINKNLIFICTGTGVAPFRSMIHSIFNENIPHKNIHLIFGTRYKEGILYREEFESLQKKYPEFKYSVVLSREENWEGYKGYVHQVYEEEYGVVSDENLFYLCGWSYVVDETTERLKKIGYDDRQIRFELYG